MHSFLDVKGLDIGYNKPLVNGVNLSLPNTGMYAIMGLNGSGKTTLLKTILGLKEPLNGEVLINGVNVSKLSITEKAKLISMVFSREVIADGLDVYSYLELGRVPYLDWSMKLSEEDNIIVEDTIQKLNLEEHRSKQLSDLSDGEKQRVAIAKSLVQSTPILFLDEPSSHLDLKGRQEVFKLLKEISTSKLVIFISHELDLVEKYADKVFLLHENKVKEIEVELNIKHLLYSHFDIV